MKILVLNAHWGNRGDEAAIRAMIDSLRAELPVEKMWIMIMDPKPAWFPYEDIEVLEYYPWLWLSPNPLAMGGLADAAVNILTVGRLSFTRRGRCFLRALGETDIVVHAPGGPAIGALYGSMVELPYLHRLFVARVLRGKPLFFYAPSMGPFSGRLRNTLRRFILRRADALTVREEISRGYLRDQLGLQAEATLDSAFQNDIPADYLSRYDNIGETLALIGQNRTIGLVATDLKWYPAYSQSGEMAARLTSTLVELTGDLLSRGYSIVLIPQLFGGAQAIDERRLLERITGLDSKRIQLLPADIDSFGQQALIARLFCVISMRYHPVVFAAKASVPFISIYYEHKAKGFVEKTGMSEFSIDVQNLTVHEVITRFAALERDHETLKDRLRTVAPLLQRESRRTTAILVAGVRQCGWDVPTSHPIRG